MFHVYIRVSRICRECRVTFMQCFKGLCVRVEENTQLIFSNFTRCANLRRANLKLSEKQYCANFNTSKVCFITLFNLRQQRSVGVLKIDLGFSNLRIDAKHYGIGLCSQTMKKYRICLTKLDIVIQLSQYNNQLWTRFGKTDVIIKTKVNI